MATITEFITWKEQGDAIGVWFNHAAACEAGLVRRMVGMDIAPCWAPETIENIRGKYHLVEAESDHDTLDEAKAAAIESAVEYILDEYRPR